MLARVSRNASEAAKEAKDQPVSWVVSHISPFKVAAIPDIQISIEKCWP